ncbi:helix-turn-helix domain-containing protein [Longirhabdus pacifica]|uniref:helix-turn-helix domain-containing protein n=1 Tax=Longirhabdus pacifica TaxID=2305227 RepID=UPI001008F561|nr:helix-turn-helix transcriptional regulator [Longirhabdus pacifica]
MSETTIQTLGELVKKHREQQNITLGTLQEKLGINKGVICKLENGETKRPEFRTIFTIADELNIPHEYILDRYVDVEFRPHIIFELLERSTTLSNKKLTQKIALAYLESDKHETDDALSSLYRYAKTLKNQEIRLTLYIVIAEYARLRGIPPFTAKGLVEAYFINFQDITKDKKTYTEGKEIIHYMDFLPNETQREFYFKMCRQAFALKEYEEAIQLTQCGLSISGKPTELETRAYGTMIYAYYHLEKYEEVEKYLPKFEQLNYLDNIKEVIQVLRANIKAKQKEYDTAISMLKQCYMTVNYEDKIDIINDLMSIYFELNRIEDIQQIIQTENEFIPTDPVEHHYKGLGKYYVNKGNFKMKHGTLNEAIHCYSEGLKRYVYIQQYEEALTIYAQIISSCVENNYELNAPQLQQINEAAKMIKKK